MLRFWLIYVDCMRRRSSEVMKYKTKIYICHQAITNGTTGTLLQDQGRLATRSETRTLTRLEDELLKQGQGRPAARPETSLTATSRP